MPYIQHAENKTLLPSGHVSDIGLALKHVTGFKLIKGSYARYERDEAHSWGTRCSLSCNAQTLEQEVFMPIVVYIFF